MKGVERFEGLGPQGGSEGFGMPIEAPEVQGALMLVAHRAAHKADPMPPVINLEDLEQNAAVESAASDAWIEEADGTLSRAAAFRAYREKYPHRRIDTRNEDALEELLSELDKEREAMKAASQLH